MINLISVTCPNCSASLEIEENRKEAFCTYCGAKFLISNENEKVIHNINEIHTIDEAAIAKANADADIELRRLELEAEIRRDKSKSSLVGIILLIVYIVIFGYILKNM